ncbi:tRNA pseudouridine(54/55) synthase Pus10 [Halosegnis marinus]|uniref:tRNA pseudouridine synthase Pus10 n=1 Tax=Halosegnis marinus TaxID=3034023 RepID=A0ABD5ZPW1_9EURY|nr:tRNA pseudouridine(54/55) synthase Pus10 [Halosegnis sp. DT85]
MTLLDDARALLATGPLCDACLGRPFAERSFGLTNAERGRALRTTIALDDDEPYGTTDPADCWVCEGLCGRFEELAERAAAAVADIDFDTYQVGTRVPPLVEENDELLREDAGLEPDAGEELRKELNREVGRRLGARLEKEVDFERPDVQLLCDLDADEVTATVNSVAVYGRYRKIERDVPQTEWPCSDCGGSGRVYGVGPCPECNGTGYRYRTSVEQEVAPTLVTALRGEAGVFHGAGREDVDALMLGGGRPFVLEVKKPHRRHVDLSALEAEINEASDAVEVEGLRFATNDMIERVKEHDASKTYRMTVEFGGEVDDADLQPVLDELRGTTVEQRTPQRVDHRRADLTRERTVYDISGSTTDETHATLVIHGAGGLYIKELVSGDEGRTEPSLAGLLGVEAVVTALDVTAVEGEDEPFEHPDFFRDAEGESEEGAA